MTPRQVSRQISLQMAESPLAAAMRRLFREIGREHAWVDFRRLAVRVRRVISAHVSKAYRLMDAKKESHKEVNVTHTLMVPIAQGAIFLFLCFTILITVGRVQMGEPVVTHRLM